MAIYICDWLYMRKLYALTEHIALREDSMNTDREGVHLQLVSRKNSRN